MEDVPAMGPASAGTEVIGPGIVRRSSVRGRGPIASYMLHHAAFPWRKGQSVTVHNGQWTMGNGR